MRRVAVVFLATTARISSPPASRSQCCGNLNCAKPFMCLRDARLRFGRAHEKLCPYNLLGQLAQLHQPDETLFVEVGFDAVVPRSTVRQHVRGSLVFPELAWWWPGNEICLLPGRFCRRFRKKSCVNACAGLQWHDTARFFQNCSTVRIAFPMRRWNRLCGPFFSPG